MRLAASGEGLSMACTPVIPTKLGQCADRAGCAHSDQGGVCGPATWMRYVMSPHRMPPQKQCPMVQCPLPHASVKNVLHDTHSSGVLDVRLDPRADVVSRAWTVKKMMMPCAAHICHLCVSHTMLSQHQSLVPHHDTYGGGVGVGVLGYTSKC